MDTEQCIELASMMSSCHHVMEDLTGKQQRVPDASCRSHQTAVLEAGPHLEITIREVERATSIFDELWAKSDEKNTKELLANTLQLVYTSRFLTPAARQKARESL